MNKMEGLKPTRKTLILFLQNFVSYLLVLKRVISMSESSTLKISSKLVLIFIRPRFIPGLYFMSRNHPNPTVLQAAPPPK